MVPPIDGLQLSIDSFAIKTRSSVLVQYLLVNLPICSVSMSEPAKANVAVVR